MDYSRRIKQAVSLIKEAKRITAFTGAGVSTESGISDFRSPGGVWDRYRVVTFQEFLSSHDARVQYWSMKKELFLEMKNAKPNKAHLALAELEKTGKLDCLITQNIDGLHQDAGSTNVIELHGTNRKAICVKCGKSWPIEEIQVILESGNLDPCCDICNGFIKPATISFGQPMPEKEMLDAYECASRCDLFLMAGSSLRLNQQPQSQERLTGQGQNSYLLTAQKHLMTNLQLFFSERTQERCWERLFLANFSCRTGFDNERTSAFNVLNFCIVVRREDNNTFCTYEKSTPSAASAMRWKVKRSALVQAVNAVGGLLGPLGSVQLQEEGLLEEAHRQTGLDDFGSPSFHEPLRRLLASMEMEARLNPMGRLAARHDLIRLLVNRLRLEEDRKLNPAIAEQRMPRPIIITGLPRTGTTLLHRLLALDPANRVALTWETMYPSPPPDAATYRSDPRIRVVERQLRWFHRLLKDFNRIHPIGASLPEECLVILSNSFLSYQFETTHRLPSYLGWLLGQDLRPAYEMHRRILQNLQWRCPGKRWILKAPAHMFDFEALFSVYPDACIVMTHRDPMEVTASNSSLTATLRSAFSDEVNPFEIGPECSSRWASAINRAIESRDRGGAPAERFLDIYYADLTADPVSAVKKVYTSFDLPVPDGLEEKVREFLRRNPKDRFGKHRYSLDAFGLNVEEEMRRYRAYRQRFRL